MGDVVESIALLFGVGAVIGILTGVWSIVLPSGFTVQMIAAGATVMIGNELLLVSAVTWYLLLLIFLWIGTVLRDVELGYVS